MNDRLKEIEDEIEKLKLEQLKLEKEAIEQKALTPQQRLAEVLHDKFCNGNHTDDCSWEYYKWTDNLGEYSDRKRYLEKATKLLTVVNYNVALKVIDAIKGY